MGEEAALAEPVAKGVGDLLGGAGEAASGAGDFLGGAGEAAASGVGDLAGAGASAGGYGLDPGFSVDAFDYLSGGAAPAAAGGAGDITAASSGFDPATSGGNSAFDPGSYAGAAGGGSTPDWLNGSTMFDTGAAGAAPPADFSGGVNSFNSPGVSSFSDTMAAGGAGPMTSLQTGGGADFAGAGSSFTPGPGIQIPDAASVDPTSLAATGDVTTPPNAQPTSGQSTPLPVDRPAGAGPSAADLAASSGTAPQSFAGTSGANSVGGTAATAAAPATAASGSGNTFLGMDIGKPTLMGSAGALLSGGLLAKNLLTNTVPGQDQVNALNSSIPQIQSTIDNVNKTAEQLRNSTQPLTAEAQQMMSYVSQGTLPPAMQAQVSAGVQAAKAQAASIMAQHGLSADPTRNAQLKQQFDTIDSQAIQLQGTLATQLYQSGLAAIGAANQTQSVAANLQSTGLSALGLTNNTYLALQKIYADQDKTQQAAISNFAGALGRISGGGGTTIKVGS